MFHIFNQWTDFHAVSPFGSAMAVDERSEPRFSNFKKWQRNGKQLTVSEFRSGRYICQSTFDRSVYSCGLVVGSFRIVEFLRI